MALTREERETLEHLRTRQETASNEWVDSVVKEMTARDREGTTPLFVLFVQIPYERPTTVGAIDSEDIAAEWVRTNEARMDGLDYYYEAFDLNIIEDEEDN